MLNDLAEVDADVLGHTADGIRARAGVGSCIQAGHVKDGQVAPQLVRGDALRVEEHVVIVQDLSIQLPGHLRQGIPIHQAAEGGIASDIDVLHLFVVEDLHPRRAAKEVVVHAVPRAILLGRRTLAHQTHGTQAAVDIPAAELSQLAVALPGILLQGERLQVGHVLEHILAEALQQVVLQVEELQQIEVGQGHGIYVRDQAVVHVQGAQVGQNGKLIGSQPLEGIPIQIEYPQAIVSHEGVLVEHLQLVVRQVDLHQDLQIAKGLLVYVLHLGLLEVNALQIEQPQSGELLPVEIRDVVVVQHQHLELRAQGVRNGGQLQGAADGRLLAVGPLAGAVGGAAQGPVIRQSPGHQAQQNPAD